MAMRVGPDDIIIPVPAEQILVDIRVKNRVIFAVEGLENPE